MLYLLPMLEVSYLWWYFFMTYSYPLVADVASYQPDSLAYMQALRAYGVQAVIVKISEESADGGAYVILLSRKQLHTLVTSSQTVIVLG